MARVAAYNWPLYAVAMAVAIAAVAIQVRFAGVGYGPARVAVATAVGVGMWFIGASLIATWWAYDGSAMFRWAWLRPLLTPPRRWLTLHAGVDESTPGLRELYPGDSRAIDVFVARTMPEASLRRARARFTPEVAAEGWDGRRLPADDASVDAVFAFFALHELRSDAARTAIIAEIRRVLTSDGSAVVVEHLRDVANAIVYGPGAWHFHARRTWLRAFSAGGLEVVREVRINVFVRAFVLRHACRGVGGIPGTPGDGFG
ncbi:MAG TPA: class I SAM-dependent methyltransferase [Planctomycetota bacterium]|nr:class I SAM-dependent methyltransferase [Planctomycetota bacterium]